jgi:hypothetical protein
MRAEGTPTEIIDKLNREINAALVDPKLKAGLADLGGAASKYPPAEPGALGLEPLEAAGPCCINPHSYSHCAMPPQEPSVLLGHPYLTFW